MHCSEPEADLTTVDNGGAACRLPRHSRRAGGVPGAPWEQALQGAREIGHNATTVRATNIAFAAVVRYDCRSLNDDMSR